VVEGWTVRCCDGSRGGWCFCLVWGGLGRGLASGVLQNVSVPELGFALGENCVLSVLPVLCVGGALAFGMEVFPVGLASIDLGVDKWCVDIVTSICCLLSDVRFVARTFWIEGVTFVALQI